jgi:hypothetical protein
MLDVGKQSQRANIITDPKAILRRPSAAHKPFNGKLGLSQSLAPEQKHKASPSAKHIGPNATAMGKKCTPTINRLANRADRSPAFRYLAKPKRNRAISSAIEPNKNQSRSLVGFPNGAISRPPKVTSAAVATTKAQKRIKSRLSGRSAPDTTPIPMIIMNRPPAGTMGKTGAQDSG